MTDEQEEKFPLEDEDSRYRLLPLKRTGSNSTPSERPNLFYQIYYNPQRDEISLTPKEGCITIIPKDTDGHNRVWRWGKESLLERIHSEIVVKKGRNGAYAIYAKDRIKEGRKPKTVWKDPKYDASSHGTILLKKILDKRKTFNYPKSLYAVKDLLEICTRGKKQALILDYFAGSGTTGHAILELNKDGGNRKFILCTNNENQIAENVCYPRIRKVIKGYKNTNNEFTLGLGSNLKYYKTDFVPFANTDSDKRALTNKSTEMLCMSEETYDEILYKKGEFSLFENGSKITAIIYDEDYIESCKSEIKKHKKSITIYVFSYDKEYNPEDFDDLKGRIKIKPIPEAILNIYRKIGRK